MEKYKIEKCEGYLWWSDQQAPKVYDGDALDLCFDETKNPFVVEGQLYDVEEKKSYSIKYVDGKYLIKIYEVEDLDFSNADNEIKCYLSNRMGGRWLKFLRFWEPTEEGDENCEGISPLVISKNVFVGFKK